MKTNPYPPHFIFYFTFHLIILIFSLSIKSQSNFISPVSPPSQIDNTDLPEWAYISIDDKRAKWGDYDEPEWLRYFGLDAADLTGNGGKDIVAGRYFYRNPGDSMEEPWERIDLGFNVDGMLFTSHQGNVSGILATALPNVFFLKPSDAKGSEWEAEKIAELPPTSHVNGQGYCRALLFQDEVEYYLLATGEGIFYLKMPVPITNGEQWLTKRISPLPSDEGFAAGDINGNGYMDVVAGKREGDEGDGMELCWWENPGNETEDWDFHIIGNTKFDADRICIGDVNGDGYPDVIVTEERYPGKEPDASLFWFEHPGKSLNREWKRHKVVTQYSMNNLDLKDMTGNGFMDIITAEHKGPQLEVQVWVNNGEGQFSKVVVDRGKESHLGARVWDMNGNGKNDIVSIGWDQHEYLHLWRNDN